MYRYTDIGHDSKYINDRNRYRHRIIHKYDVDKDTLKEDKHGNAKTK